MESVNRATKLIGVLESQVMESDNEVSDGAISTQRMRNHQYYAGEALGNEVENRSQHVSMDVFDSVESKKSLFSEVFMSDARPIRFKQESPEDGMYDLATEYTNHQFYVRNRGERFLEDSWHDAFVAKRCVARVEWKNDTDKIIQHFEDAELEALVQLRHAGAEFEEITEDPQTKLLTGKAVIEQDTSLVDVVLVPPENFFRDSAADYMEKSSFAGEFEDVTRMELMKRGYPEEVVMKLSVDYKFRTHEEDHARKSHDSSWRNHRSRRADILEIVTVYRTYTYLNMAHFADDGDLDDIPRDGWPDEVGVYKIIWSCGKILEIERVDQLPYFEWTEYKIAHAEHGLADADNIAHIQKTNSSLMRLIIDNQQITNTGRFIAKSGGVIRNPEELLENHIGGVIWTRGDVNNSVNPIPPHQLSPLAFGVLDVLNREKENRSGQSDLAKGMNKDAISHQNSGDMIERLTNASNRRGMKSIRSYARDFLVPIFLRIYSLGVANDKNVYDFEVRGRWVKASPMQWPPRKLSKIDVAITKDEAMRQVQMRLMMHQAQSADPQLQMMYGPTEKHRLMDDVWDLLGVANSSQYLMRPDSPQYQQQMQQMVEQNQQMQMMQQQMTQLEVQLKIAEDRRKEKEIQLKALDHQIKAAIEQGKDQRDEERLDLEERAQDLDEWKAKKEVEIERSQARGVSIR